MKYWTSASLALYYSFRIFDTNCSGGHFSWLGRIALKKCKVSTFIQIYMIALHKSKLWKFLQWCTNRTGFLDNANHSLKFFNNIDTEKINQMHSLVGHWYSITCQSWNFWSSCSDVYIWLHIHSKGNFSICRWNLGNICHAWKKKLNWLN